MPEIKICGITTRDDALTVYEAGADALGFIFYPKSPRYVSPEQVRDIIAGLPRGITKVGVFVNEDPERVVKIAQSCGLDLLQFHGTETPSYCSRFPASMVIKALSPRTAEDIEEIDAFPVRAILVDAFAPGLYGGTGKVSNWEVAREIGEKHPLILSGGLNEGNVEEAIESVSPDAVDINSGVEYAPGKKDHAKVMKIISLICRCGRNGGERGTHILRIEDRTIS